MKLVSHPGVYVIGILRAYFEVNTAIAKICDLRKRGTIVGAAKEATIICAHVDDVGIGGVKTDVKAVDTVDLSDGAETIGSAIQSPLRSRQHNVRIGRVGL